MLKPFFLTENLECGCDEAGRGCLAGPVTASSVILPLHFNNSLLNDSKQLTEKTRKKLKVIIENEAISYSVTHIEPLEIDEINILNASIKAIMKIGRHQIASRKTNKRKSGTACLTNSRVSLPLLR